MAQDSTQEEVLVIGQTPFVVLTSDGGGMELSKEQDVCAHFGRRGESLEDLVALVADGYVIASYPFLRQQPKGRIVRLPQLRRALAVQISRENGASWQWANLQQTRAFVTRFSADRRLDSGTSVIAYGAGILFWASFMSFDEELDTFVVKESSPVRQAQGLIVPAWSVMTEAQAQESGIFLPR